MPAQAGSNIIRSEATLHSGYVNMMSIREDWMKLTRDLHEIASAFRGVVGSASGSRREKRVKPRKALLVPLNNRAVADLRIKAALEANKNLGPMYYVRNQVR